MEIAGFVFYASDERKGREQAAARPPSESESEDGNASIALVVPARVPHIDGATRHAAHITWPEPARASMVRSNAYYARSGDRLGLANVLRTRADVASAVNDYRRGAELPSSYAQARVLYERAAGVFDELIRDEKRRPSHTTRRQTMIRTARERGEPRAPISAHAVSRTPALEDGRCAPVAKLSSTLACAGAPAVDREAVLMARAALRFV
jgi:hypothetical protein